jgi:hypothetical protein
MISSIVNNILKKKNSDVNTTELDSLYKKPPPEKGLDMPSFQIFKPNYAHQADLLFLPTDKFGFKYALVVVDVHDKRVDAQAIKKKDDVSVLNAFKKIYARSILKYPKILEVDNGSEFKGETAEYFKEKGIKIHVGLTNRHRSQGLVEYKNQVIGKIILMIQAQKELETGKISKEWVKYLPDIVNDINTKLPKPLTTEKYRLPLHSKSNRDLIAIGDKVRILLDYPIDINNKKLIGKFRSGDIRYTREIYKVREVILKPSFPPLYLTDKDNVARTIQQLQPISQFV